MNRAENTTMSTKKAVGGSAAAILILVIAQVAAQLIASVFVLLKVAEGICNIIAGLLYLGLAYMLLSVLWKKIVKLPASACGMSKLKIKLQWVLVAFILPAAVKGTYLLFFDGQYVSANMNMSEIFSTLSAGIIFTGIAAGFVEEMVFRGVVLHLLKERWNLWIAVIVPSVLFGVLHVLGTDFSLGSCLLVLVAGSMAGIMFSMIAIESDSVWNSGMVHAVWNMVMIGGGLSVGEKADPYSVMTFVLDVKSFAVTGGEFGIESSVISLLGYIIVAGIAVVLMRQKKNR